MNDKRYFVDSTAIIDDNVKIGDDSKIWHFCHVMSGVEIGNDTVLGQNVFVGKNVKIGSGVRIQNNVSVYEGVILEDDVFCGPSMVFTNVINPRSDISRKDEFKMTVVKKGASIGANATIVCGVTLGEHSFIGAGSVVTKNIPPYALVYGTPAVVKGYMCSCGEKLRFDNKNKAFCKRCGKNYELIDGKVTIIK